MKKLFLLIIASLTLATAAGQTPRYDFDKAYALRSKDTRLIDYDNQPIRYYDTEDGTYIPKKAFINKYGKESLKHVRKLDNNINHYEDIWDTDYKRATYGIGQMPVNEYGEVVLSDVFAYDGFSAKDIYSAAKVSIAELFKSAQHVVQLDDSETNTMIAKGIVDVRKDEITAPRVRLTLKIQVKDARCKVEAYQMAYEYLDVGTLIWLGVRQYIEVPAEKYTDSLALYPDGKPRDKDAWRIRQRIIASARDMLFSLGERIYHTLNANDNW